MSYTVREVLEFVKQNDVKFIRLAFCDMFGTQKNISIMPDELERAFKEGVSFDASAEDLVMLQNQIYYYFLMQILLMFFHGGHNKVE